MSGRERRCLHWTTDKKGEKSENKILTQSFALHECKALTGFITTNQNTFSDGELTFQLGEIQLNIQFPEIEFYI